MSDVETIAAALAQAALERRDAIRLGDEAALATSDERLAALQQQWTALMRSAHSEEALQAAAGHLRTAQQALADAERWLQEAMQQVQKDLADLPLQRQRLEAYLRAGGPAR